MILFDMMKNAEEVSVEEIMIRQGPLGLGGVDLLHLDENTAWNSYKRSWQRFLYRFHRYCQENQKEGFQKKWSDWAKEKSVVTQEEVVSKETGQTMVFELPAKENILLDPRWMLLSLNEHKLQVQNFQERQVCSKEGMGYSASQSAVPSKEALSLLIQDLKRRASHVVVVDMVEEKSLFVNGLYLTCIGPCKEGLHELKASVTKDGTIQADSLDFQKKSRFAVVMKPFQVETPQEVVEALGAKYFHLIVGEEGFISDGELERFYAYLEAQPKDTWAHFYGPAKALSSFFD